MGKKYDAAFKLVDREKRYTVVEACELLPSLKFAKFDETVEVAARLGVNPKHADQMIRSSCALPHGTGKSLRVVVFAKGDRAAEARDAGADFVGAEDLVERVLKENWLDFDSAIATPDMMGLVGRLGRVLGPRNLMPNPKVGTVTMDVAKAIREIKAGRIEFRTEKTGIVHAPIGKLSFGGAKLQENLTSLLDTLQRLKPSTAKGKYFKSVALSSTMGPSIRLDTNDVAALVER
ncbi:50S ribosomal protein L1 [Nannocystis sp.]|uniref:50S ribosomal protein L1 n=1 Tax=Nannocystis sp. TaxID=1962667 RepID=UPI0024218F00|nr:50S ribosomal protein L1 [Nannocystis sp.]MBK7827342.1 50S ribosomal protein L1 [Nannocystis sp.]MBK9754754.1 50S ribosomal protein L1 [Nannocystis sp.]